MTMLTTQIEAVRAVDGTAIAVERTPGAGTPVLALHGLGSTKASFAPVLDAAAGHRPTWAMDLRGHGDSEHTPGGYRFVDYVHDVEAVLREIGEPAVLVGHSLGALVAARLAQAAHPLVQGVFLEDPPLYVLEPGVLARTSYARRLTRLEQAVHDLRAVGADVEAYDRVVAGTLGEGALPDAVATGAEGLQRMDVDAIRAVLDGRTAEDFIPDERLYRPVFVVHGDARCDAAFLPFHGQRLQVRTTQAQVFEVPGAGHDIRGSVTGRAAYVDLLREFLVHCG